jgi:hypothetical protein
MHHAPKLALVGLVCVAFGWALTDLKPVPQVALLALVATALVVDLSAATRAKSAAFLIAASLASLVGYVVAGTSLLTLAGRWLSPRSLRPMPIGTVVAAAAVGVALFAVTYLVALRPVARLDRPRRVSTVAILAAGLVAVGVGGLF